MQQKWKTEALRWLRKSRLAPRRSASASARSPQLRIAYDVSFPASRLMNHDRKLGIIRVIEETLFGLLASDQVDTTAVGLRGDDVEPALTSGRAHAYQELILGRRAQHIHTYASFTGLARRYEQRFTSDFHARAQRAIVAPDAASVPEPSGEDTPRGGLRLWKSRIKAAARKTIRRLVALDTRVYLPPLFDIFHATHYPLPPREVTGTARRLITIYDLIPLLSPEIVPPLWREHFMRTLRSLDVHNDWAICISEFTKADLCRVMGMPPERVFVAPLAADEHFRPVEDASILAAARQKYGLPPGEFLLTLCTPQPRKNLSHLVRCFATLVEQRPDIRTNLVLVGARTSELETLQAQINQSCREDLGRRIFFTGYVDDADLPALCSAATAFVFPSLSEGFGLPPLEAMQCGLPVICSNATSLPEVVGDAALLIDPRNEAQLVAAMAQLLTTPGLADDLRQRGLRRARQFTWAATARKTIDAYKEIARA